MRITTSTRTHGPQPAGPVTPESIHAAKEAARREREANGLEPDLGPDGRIVVKVQTYRTERVS